MDYIKNQLNESQLNKYRQALYNFDKYIEDIYSQNNCNKKHQGYLINLNDYEELKKSINHYIYKKYDLQVKKEDTNFDNSEKVFKIKQIEFKTSRFFLNMLCNENKYIIINYDLWVVICENGRENERPIIYELNRPNIKLNFEDGKQLIFRYYEFEKNIIEEITYSDCKNITNFLDEFKKIYKDINIYYQFERDFIKKLEDNKNYYSYYNYAYLVSYKWVDKWKKYSNYEEIKNYYLEKK